VRAKMLMGLGVDGLGCVPVPVEWRRDWVITPPSLLCDVVQVASATVALGRDVLPVPSTPTAHLRPFPSGAGEITVPVGP